MQVAREWKIFGMTVRLLNSENLVSTWEVWCAMSPFLGRWEPWDPVCLQPYVANGLFGSDHEFWPTYKRFVSTPGEPPEHANEPLYALARRLGYSDIGDCERVVETIRAVLRGDLEGTSHE